MNQQENMMALILAGLTLASAQIKDLRPPTTAPGVVEVQRAALNYSGFADLKTKQWERDSKLQALLPKLSAGYSRRLHNNIDVDVSDSVYVGSSGVAVGPQENAYSRDSYGQHNIEVKAMWELNELVFSRDILSIAAEHRSMIRERNAILAEVNKNYHDRLKLIGEVALLKTQRVPRSLKFKQQQKIMLKEIDIEEKTSELDALTGGWFSKRLKDNERGKS